MSSSHEYTHFKPEYPQSSRHSLPVIDTVTSFVGLDPVPGPVVLPSPQFIRVSVDEGDRTVARNIIRDTADTVAVRTHNLYPFPSMQSIETPSATEEPIEEEESHSHEVTLVQVVDHDGETPDVQVSHSAGPNPASTDGREDIESGSPNCPKPLVSFVSSLSTSRTVHYQGRASLLR